MKRRGFLKATSVVATPTAASSTVIASSPYKAVEVDFEKLITNFYTKLPDTPEELRDVLEDVANIIHENGRKIDEPLIEKALSSIGDAEELARRTKFVIDILHNNDLGNYLDDTWVVAARNNLKVITRFLPLATSFNNLYLHAKDLDNTVKEKLEVKDEKYETFGYALLAFAIEVGFFCYGTPYRMAWRGTRFVSNRTLLRVGEHLDNKLIALVMSEIHWKIREEIYEEINADNLGFLGGLLSSGKHLDYILGEVDDLQSFARDEVEASYMKNVDLNIDRETLKEWDLKELSESNSNDDDGGIGSFL